MLIFIFDGESDAGFLGLKACILRGRTENSRDILLGIRVEGSAR